MTHQERLKYAQTMNSAGTGLIVAGVGAFVGLTGGLWSSIGAGAIGVGVGAASGLWLSSCFGPYKVSKETLAWDKEIEEGSRGDDDVAEP